MSDIILKLPKIPYKVYKVRHFTEENSFYRVKCAVTDEKIAEFSHLFLSFLVATFIHIFYVHIFAYIIDIMCIYNMGHG